MAPEKILLNLGCGTVSPKGWINCDSSLHAQLTKVPLVHGFFRLLGIVSGSNWADNVRYISLNKPFPWADSSVDCVYASHVLEHLRVGTAREFIRESYRVLKPTGVIRIVVPDLYYHAKKYVEGHVSTGSAAADFLHTIHLQIPDEIPLINKLVNLLSDYPTIHKYMYDRVTLTALFSEYGFRDIKESSYAESHYLSNVMDVEYMSPGYEGSLYLEALK